MSVSDYIPPWYTIPELDPEDFEYLDHEPTQQELYEVGVHYAQTPLRKMMKDMIRTFKDNPKGLQEYFLEIINGSPDELPALREVLSNHFPQHLKFVDQMTLLKNDY